MTKRSNLITAIVVGILVISVLLIYKFKPESSALTLTTCTSGTFQIATKQSGVNVYWKHKTQSWYIYVMTLSTGGKYYPVRCCKENNPYYFTLTKPGYKNHTFSMYCPKSTVIINLTKL